MVRLVFGIERLGDLLRSNADLSTCYEGLEVIILGRGPTAMRPTFS